jgi:hypothetical protein
VGTFWKVLGLCNGVVWEDIMPSSRKAMPTLAEPVEVVVAPDAIERALQVYEQLQPHDNSVILQARKILTKHIFGMVDQGELDEQKLIVGGLAQLKAVERDHGIKSAHETASNKAVQKKASSPGRMRPKDHP